MGQVVQLWKRKWKLLHVLGLKVRGLGLLSRLIIMKMTRVVIWVIGKYKSNC